MAAGRVVYEWLITVTPLFSRSLLLLQICVMSMRHEPCSLVPLVPPVAPENMRNDSTAIILRLMSLLASEFVTGREWGQQQRPRLNPDRLHAV